MDILIESLWLLCWEQTVEVVVEAEISEEFITLIMSEMMLAQMEADEMAILVIFQREIYRNSW